MGPALTLNVMIWIFGSIWLDALFLMAPAIISLLLFFSDILNPNVIGLVGLIVFTWIDSGHIYLTTLRTYFHRKELESSKKYFWGPVFIFLILFKKIFHLQSFISRKSCFHG